MGIQVHSKSYCPGYCSMTDLNEDSNSSSWPLFFGDKTLTSGQYYNAYVARTTTDSCPGYDKDALKKTMLQHEAVFKSQVYELHRLYRIQRDMMQEFRRKELHKRHMSIEPSSSSSLLGSQMPSEDAGKWHISSFPLANSSYPRPSVSGAEIVNSPLSCMKGNNVQAGQANNSTSKDCEVLEVRPSKVRKKLFDLQLPADEYIDPEEGEQSCANKISNVSVSFPNGKNKTAYGNHGNLFLNGRVGKKYDSQRDASTLESRVSKTMRLADLNEPVQLEEGFAPSSVDFIVNSTNSGNTKVLNASPKQSSDLQEEIRQNATNHGNQHGNLNNLSVDRKDNEKNWLSGVYESGKRKCSFISVHQGLQQDQLLLPAQPPDILPNKVHQSCSILPTDHGRDEFREERTGRGLKTLDRIHDTFKVNHLDSVITSLAPSSYPFINSLDYVNSWSHSALSWGKPTSSLTEKLSSFPAYPPLNSSVALSKSSQSSAQSHDVLGEKWHINGSSRLNTGLGDLPIMNGFNHGCSSRSKEMLAQHPSASLSHLNCNASSRSLIHGPEDLHKGSNHLDVKPAKNMDLNVFHANCSSIERVSAQHVDVINEKMKPEDHLDALPWLTAKPASKSAAVNARRDGSSQDSGLFKASQNQFIQKTEPVVDIDKKFSQKVIPTLSDSKYVAKEERGEAQGIKKILGFPIFEKPPTSSNETSLPISTPVTLEQLLSGGKVDTEGKVRAIDINLACDELMASEVVTVENTVDTKVAHIKGHIDLNLCVSEDEDALATSGASNSASVKIAMHIDLEAPVLEDEDDALPGKEHKQPGASLLSPNCSGELTQDEADRMAAEAIVLLSSLDQHVLMEESTCQPSEDCLVEPLLWLAEIVSSYVDVHEAKGGTELKGTDGLLMGSYSSDKMDDFVVMTLQLQETKEEDYMPKPFLPEMQKMEESGANMVPNRTRKAQARRGRQRRDFQRDILPGLTSLSRHEVTEDLQIFGGLMRATGLPWNSGLTRRNGTRSGGARGRRRLVVDTVSTAVANAACTPLMQQLNNIEVGLEDRSLRGWGKTTRRPRRQRCPTGNPPTIPLT